MMKAQFRHPTSYQAATLLGFLGLGGCGSDFDGPSLLNKIRFITVLPSSPWVAPGETSTLVPLLSRPNGNLFRDPGPDELTFRWSWCPLRGPNTFAYDCLITEEDVEAVAGTTVPEDIFELGTSNTAEFAFNFPPTLFEGDPDDPSDGLCDLFRSSDDISRFVTLPECDGRYTISIEVEVIAPGEPAIRAYKDLTLVYDTERFPNEQINVNPVSQVQDLEDPFAISQFALALGLSRPVPNVQPGEPLPLIPGEVVQVNVRTSADTGSTALEDLYALSQLFEDAEEDLDGNIVRSNTRERLRLSWFVSGGDIDDSRTGFLPNDTLVDGQADPSLEGLEWSTARTNLWRVPLLSELPNGGQSEEDRAVFLYVVIADERGGISALGRELTVQAP